MRADAGSGLRVLLHKHSAGRAAAQRLQPIRAAASMHKVLQRPRSRLPDDCNIKSVLIAPQAHDASLLDVAGATQSG